MLRLSSLLLMGMVLASFGLAQDRDEHRWENVESLRVGQKLEVTTTQLRTDSRNLLEFFRSSHSAENARG